MNNDKHAEAVAPDVRPAVAVRHPAIVTGIDVLQTDEIIQISLRPSLWFILIVSYQWVLACALLAGLIAFTNASSWTFATTSAFNGAIGVAGVRVCFATLQWASRLYVLTNRRILRFRGVLQVDVAECRLTNVSNIEMRVSMFQRVLGLGDIRVFPQDERRRFVDWDHVAHPLEIREILDKAVRRTQFGE